MALVLIFTAPVLAYDPGLDRPITQAKQVLNEIMASPDQSIPEELLAKCRALVIYPSLIKGGFIFGGRYGKGVVLKHDKKTGAWGPVAYSTIAGVSFGFQIGIQATDLVLVIMNNKGLEGLLSSKLTLGADAALSVGPVGRTTEIATDLSLRAGILAYSRSRGLFGGLALNGAIVVPDNGSNSAYYGKAVTSKEILLNNGVEIQPSSKELIESLNDYSERWQKRAKFLPKS